MSLAVLKMRPSQKYLSWSVMWRYCLCIYRGGKLVRYGITIKIAGNCLLYYQKLLKSYKELHKKWREQNSWVWDSIEKKQFAYGFLTWAALLIVWEHQASQVPDRSYILVIVYFIYLLIEGLLPRQQHMVIWWLLPCLNITQACSPTQVIVLNTGLGKTHTCNNNLIHNSSPKNSLLPLSTIAFKIQHAGINDPFDFQVVNTRLEKKTC